LVYYGLPVLVTENEIENKTDIILKNDLRIEQLKIGFDDTKKLFFIEMEFIENNIRRIDRIEKRKILLPFSNWILFSVSKNWISNY